MSAPIDAQEVRDALEARAQFDDTAALARLGSVKARVRVVRRRRRVALAGAAAAVVAAAGGIAALVPGEREVAPVSRTFGELIAPKTMRSSGAVYTFDRMVTGTDRVSVSDAFAAPSLVTWAATGEGAVTVNRLDGGSRYASAEDFRDFLSVPVAADGAEQSFALEGEGRLALAVYELTTPAEGATAEIDGTPVVLRDEVPGSRAIASVWGEPGETDVTLTFTWPERQVDLAHFCSAPKGFETHVDLEGPVTSGMCDDQPSVDSPGSRVGFTDGLALTNGQAVPPGEEVTARMWLSREGSDEPVEGTVDGVRMGMAFYETDPVVATIGDWPLTELREEGGHTWRFVQVIDATQSSTRFTVEERPLLGVLTASDAGGMVTVLIDGGDSTSYENATGGGSFLASVGPFGSGTHTVGVRAKGSPTVELALYEQVD